EPVRSTEPRSPPTKAQSTMVPPQSQQDDSGVNRKTLSGLPPWLQDLLERMEEEMVLRGFTQDTRRVYVAYVRRFYQGPGWENAGAEACGEVDPVAGNDQVR
ncbi:MAG: hypothetical protein MUO50_09790, partial [Longimicrobiales bacterium]|nr:hypothetical protein [Longimicrobiales bacterium]